MGRAVDKTLTQWLHEASDGSPEAFEEVATRVYVELERVAARQLWQRFGGAQAGLTLDTASLVHETFLKLLEAPRDFENRRHFYAFASKVMLRVLLDYTRGRAAAKRGGDQVRLTLSGMAAPADASPTSSLDLNRSLERLEGLDPRKAEIVKLRVLWGLELQEIADLLGISLRTTERDWSFSRRWLTAALMA
jgi:RNA polymerase sigma factor (TIGR02999 family)